VTHIGDIIRRQRELRRLSVRRFAQIVGISNPYLSQIERGLRAPSNRVVEAMARSLEMSADDLYAMADIAPLDDTTPSAVAEAIAADPALTPRARRILLDVYDALVLAGPVLGQRRPRSEPAGD
jgi:transcriptional regulator with XRE-family HTH domain